MPEIREIANEKEMENSVKVIADSFCTVAVEFNLTKDNCPTHPSLVTLKQLTEMKRKGLKLFGLFEDDVQVGFAAVEKKKHKVFNLEKLAVLPEYRHKGYGGQISRICRRICEKCRRREIIHRDYQRAYRFEEMVRSQRLQRNLGGEIRTFAVHRLFYGKNARIKP